MVYSPEFDQAVSTCCEQEPFFGPLTRHYDHRVDRVAVVHLFSLPEDETESLLGRLIVIIG